MVTWDTNKALRQEACTTYVGHRHPLEYQRVPRLGLPLTWNLKARAKLAGLVSTHIPDGNSARKMGSKKETTCGNQSFQKLIPFLYFLGLLIYLLLYIRMKWQPTPVFLPGKSHGCRSLVAYSPWGCKELDTTE